MARNKIILPTCYDKLPCFAKAGSYCTILRETYRHEPCPFRKTYEENIALGGKEYQPKQKGGGEHEPDFWELFSYCSEH